MDGIVQPPVTARPRPGTTLAATLRVFNAHGRQVWETREMLAVARPYGLGGLKTATWAVVRETVPAVLAFGNIVVLEGANEPWLGVIRGPKRWAEDRLTFTVSGLEALLADRFTDVLALYENATAGYVMGELLRRAVEVGPLPIFVGDVMGGGPRVTKDYRLANVLESMDQLARDMGVEWRLRPVVRDRPEAALDVLGRVGRARAAVVLQEGVNCNVREYVEDDQAVVNEVLLVGGTATWGQRPAEKAASLAVRRAVQWPRQAVGVVTDVYDAVYLREQAANLLAGVGRKAGLDVFDVGLWKAIGVGDTVRVRAHSVAGGLDGEGRVMAYTVDEIGGLLSTVVEML